MRLARFLAASVNTRFYILNKIIKIGGIVPTLIYTVFTTNRRTLYLSSYFLISTVSYKSIYAIKYCISTKYLKNETPVIH